MKKSPGTCSLSYCSLHTKPVDRQKVKRRTCFQSEDWTTKRARRRKIFGVLSAEMKKEVCKIWRFPNTGGHLCLKFGSAKENCRSFMRKETNFKNAIIVATPLNLNMVIICIQYQNFFLNFLFFALGISWNLSTTSSSWTNFRIFLSLFELFTSLFGVAAVASSTFSLAAIAPSTSGEDDEWLTSYKTSRSDCVGVKFII